VPDEVIDDLSRMGLFSISIPKEYGGMGLSAERVLPRVRGGDGVRRGAGIILGVHLSIGIKGIVLAGTEAQKRLYLPKAATGEWFASFALTEPGAGSDAQGIEVARGAVGRRKPLDFERRQDLDRQRLVQRGHRHLRADAGGAEGRDGGPGDGVHPAPRHARLRARTEPLRKMGARGSNQAELYFRDVRVPPENVLGEVGEGFKLAMRILNSGRQGLSAGAAGGVRTACGWPRSSRREREQFGGRSPSTS
jgi:acyl-CoA dehydrogenase family protein 9